MSSRWSNRFEPNHSCSFELFYWMMWAGKTSRNHYQSSEQNFSLCSWEALFLKALAFHIWPNANFCFYQITYPRHKSELENIQLLWSSSQSGCSWRANLPLCFLSISSSASYIGGNTASYSRWWALNAMRLSNMTGATPNLSNFIV